VQSLAYGHRVGAAAVLPVASKAAPRGAGETMVSKFVWMDVWMNGCMYVCIHTYGWMDGWMDEWMHVCMYPFIHTSIRIYIHTYTRSGKSQWRLLREANLLYFGCVSHKRIYTYICRHYLCTYTQVRAACDDTLSQARPLRPMVTHKINE
jgi:hypothetical protein